PLIYIYCSANDCSFHFINELLQKSGYRTSIALGNNYWHKDQIRLSNAVIILLSHTTSTTIGSNEKMVRISYECHKPIIPVRLEPIEPPFYLNNIQCIDLFEKSSADQFSHKFNQTIL